MSTLMCLVLMIAVGVWQRKRGYEAGLRAGLIPQKNLFESKDKSSRYAYTYQCSFKECDDFYVGANDKDFILSVMENHFYRNHLNAQEKK